MVVRVPVIGQYTNKAIFERSTDFLPLILKARCVHRWYRGTVVSYNAKKDTHHVKYADKDKLDICVRHEAVILITELEVCYLLSPVGPALF